MCPNVGAVPAFGTHVQQGKSVSNSSIEQSNNMQKPSVGARMARRIRGRLVTFTQWITERPLWDSLGLILALDGYWTKEEMAGVRLSWFFSIDRTHEMHAGGVARVIVWGECLCVYRSAEWRASGEMRRAESPEQTGEALAPIPATSAWAMRCEAARLAQAASDLAPHGRHWIARPAW